MKRGMGSPKYDKDRAREVQALGGRAMNALGLGHRWPKWSEALKAVGRKGGLQTQARRRARAGEV